MSKKAFSSYRSQGWRIERLHVIGRAQVAYLTHRTEPPCYAVRFRARQTRAPTLAEAVAAVRARCLPRTN